MMKKPYTAIAVIILFGFSGLVASCNFERNVVDKIEEDRNTGVIYNTDWQNTFDPENAYYNNTNGLVNVYEGPAKTYKVIAYVKPNEGGFIKNCNFDLQYCLVNFGGKPETGWVDMTYLKEGKIEYSR